MKKTYDTILWAGSQEAFQTYLQAEEKSLELSDTIKKEAALHAQASEDASHLLQVHDGIGLLQIKGVLTVRDEWYNRYMGLVSYNEIQEALYYAVSDPAIKEILVDMGSPGGDVSGLVEAVHAMDQAASVKPVTLFAENVIASAAMWLGMPAWKLYVGTLTAVGSIGVIAKHVEFSKMRQEAGITETIIRAGEFKQLANDSEPLTEQARSIIKGSAEYAYGVFVQSVADYLGKSYQLVDSQMAQGREFTGQQAVDIGLVDGVSTFDEVFATMQTRISTNSNGGDMKKKTLMSKAVALAAAAAGADLGDKQTPEELAEAKAAADLEAQSATPEKLAEAAVLKADEMDTKLEAQDAITEEEQAEADTLRAEANALVESLEKDTPEPKAKKGGAEDNEPTALDLLKSQLKEKEEEIFNLKTDLAAAKADTKYLDELKAISAASVNNMTVALGGAKVDLAGATSAELVAQHAAMTERFTTEFKVGGVSAVAGDGEEADSGKETAKPSRMAAVRSGMAPKAK